MLEQILAPLLSLNFTCPRVLLALIDLRGERFPISASNFPKSEPTTGPMSLALRVLKESLAGIKPAPRQALGVVHLRFVGLHDESWTIAIRSPRCTVEAGAPRSSTLQLFCTKAQLEAVIAGETNLSPLRFVGSRDLLEHLAVLLGSAKNLLVIRASHQAKHFAKHFRDELDTPEEAL